MSQIESTAEGASVLSDEDVELLEDVAEGVVKRLATMSRRPAAGDPNG